MSRLIKKAVVVGADAVLALVGIVYHENDGYLVDRDTCFLTDLEHVRLLIAYNEDDANMQYA